MPVSAAGEPATMLYNGVELPNIDTVWTDKMTYPYACIYLNPENVYRLCISSYPMRYKTENSKTGLWFEQSTSFISFAIDKTYWKQVSANSNARGLFSGGNGTDNRHGYIVYWSSYDFVDFDGTVYLVASDPVDPNAPTPITGRMVFGSEQVLDSFASFVLQVGDLSDTTASFSYGYKLFSGGEELRSVLDDGTVTGSDNYLIHSTIIDLDPETEYEIIYTLYANGEPTEITASTTFTTLASSGSGGGSDPDYSGQLNGIQQGIGEIQDSVDNVGSKVDDIQDMLTETKEEITSLPGKIASAILDGIKSLFVPSEEDLTEIKDKYENMLSEKLGFVWQAFDLLTTFVGDLQTSLESGEAYEFNFPGVKLPMQGEEFVLVPETAVSLDNGLMDVLRPVLGTVISMIAVIAFVNMAHDYVLAIISGVSAYQFERRKE